MTEDWMTKGEVWIVSGLLDSWPFEQRFTAWNTFDPERTARLFYDGQTCLTNAKLTRSVEARTEPITVATKNSYADEVGGPCAPTESEGDAL